MTADPSLLADQPHAAGRRQTAVPHRAAPPPSGGWEHRAIDCGHLPAEVHASCFVGPSGVAEHHLVVRPTRYGGIDEQLDWVASAYRGALTELNLAPQTALFRRFFCSDLPNQAAALEARPFADPLQSSDPCAVSWVGQPPAPPVKVALWAYHTTDPGGPLDKTQDGSSLTLRRGELAHIWTTGLHCPTDETSYQQTRSVFQVYESLLQGRGLRLADHVLRTWLFVQNVDANYKGLVIARRELFAQRGLTADTHFIASTGIEGGGANVAAKVTMDAYAIAGVRPDQIQHLQALDHLCPTGIYGVTFERATAVHYRDRRQVFVSGTASIDHNGYILYPGDVARQLDRTLENVAALLDQAGATLRDMGVFVGYVRDPADQVRVEQLLRERCGEAPVVVVKAPVCRPGWLVEVEGLAVVPAANPELPVW